eukprot:406452-Pyramimonas_sp.AAC.1
MPQGVESLAEAYDGADDGLADLWELRGGPPLPTKGKANISLRIRCLNYFKYTLLYEYTLIYTVSILFWGVECTLAVIGTGEPVK